MATPNFSQYKDAKKVAENPVDFLQKQAVDVLKELREALEIQRFRLDMKRPESEWKPKYEKNFDKVYAIDQLLQKIGGRV